MDIDKALVKMGADEDGFPLAAIYRTRHGLQLGGQTDPGVVEAAAIDTDPPQSINEVNEVVFDDVTPQPDYPSDEPDYTDLVDLLGRHIPTGMSPRAIADLLRMVSENELNHMHDENAWYRRAFSADTFLTRPPRMGRTSQLEADFLIKTLGLSQGCTVLDVGCGYGRISNLLAQRGMNVIGVDLSEDMLRHAQAVATKSDIEIQYVLGDMRSIDYEDQFDAVVSTDTSFGYFSDAQNLLALSKMAQAVRFGGRVTIDMLCRERALVETPSRSWWEGQGCLIQEDADFDQITSRLNIKRLLVFSDGRQNECVISIRLYTAAELVDLCRLAGLQLVELSGSIYEQGAYFSASSRRLIATFQKV